jgi:hypothetical protein
MLTADFTDCADFIVNLGTDLLDLIARPGGQISVLIVSYPDSYRD